MPTIWIDADATPKPVREVICKGAIRTQIKAIFVANHRIPIPTHPNLQSIQVEAGFDVADNLIVQRCQNGDLLITQDIPLAAEAMQKQVTVINNRGEVYTEETIRQRLNMRDFMDNLRSSGINTGGPNAFNAQDKQTFSNAFDRWLTKNK